MGSVDALLDPARLHALHRTGLLDAPADEKFDRFTRLAQLSLGVPIALISLVGDKRQFFTSHAGLSEPWATERVTPLSLCAEITRSGEPLILSDLREDPVRSQSSVAQALEIAGFVGIPLVDAEGYVLGAMCAIDHDERNWTDGDIEILSTLAAAASARIQLHVSKQDAALLAEDRQAILDSSLDCILVMDHQGLVREWNAAAETTLGWTREEALGRRLGDLVVPEELRELHEAGLKRAAETGESRIIGQRLRLPVLRKDGGRFTAELAITKVEREGHALFTGTIRDITEIVRAEEALQAAEERYRSLIENIPLATYMNSVDEPFTSLYVSPQIESLLGYTPEEWAARPELAAERIHPDDGGRIAALACEARKLGIPTRSEFRFLARDGRVVWVLDQTIPVRDADGNVIHHQGFLLDITEQKRLEEQLRQSQKMDAIGQLAGGIAHDFNNMLTAISGYADLLALSFEDGDDPRADDVQQIRKAAAHAAGLTRQLLAFGRRQVLCTERLDVNDVVRNLESMLARTIGGEVELETVLAENLAQVETDPDQLVQVILNIALNGRDAMPGGGRLRLATGSVESNGDHFVAVEVSDTGTGMDEQVRSRLFEPFFTTKEKGKGTGLGLATAYGVVSQSGGRIEVESTPGEGSIFRVLLPAA